MAGDAASSTGQRAEVGDVAVLVDEVQAAAPTNKGVTATHLKTRLRTLRRGAGITAGVIAYCAPRFNRGAVQLTRTPFLSSQDVKLISIKVTKGRTRRLEAGEADRILGVANPYIADFFTAMIETGCRPGELRTLQWSEVQADGFVILAAKAKDRDERKVPIEPTLRAILDRRRIGPDGHDLPATA